MAYDVMSYTELIKLIQLAFNFNDSISVNFNDRQYKIQISYSGKCLFSVAINYLPAYLNAEKLNFDDIYHQPSVVIYILDCNPFWWPINSYADTPEFLQMQYFRKIFRICKDTFVDNKHGTKGLRRIMRLLSAQIQLEYLPYVTYVSI